LSQSPCKVDKVAFSDVQALKAHGGGLGSGHNRILSKIADHAVAQDPAAEIRAVLIGIVITDHSHAGSRIDSQRRVAERDVTAALPRSAILAQSKRFSLPAPSRRHVLMLQWSENCLVFKVCT
jgi:hypothetical protein